jgi:hypothetical protein
MSSQASLGQEKSTEESHCPSLPEVSQQVNESSCAMDIDTVPNSKEESATCSNYEPMEVDQKVETPMDTAVTLSPTESWPDDELPIAQAVKHPALAHAVTETPVPIVPQFDLIEQAMQQQQNSSSN